MTTRVRSSTYNNIKKYKEYFGISGRWGRRCWGGGGAGEGDNQDCEQCVAKLQNKIILVTKFLIFEN